MYCVGPIYVTINDKTSDNLFQSFEELLQWLRLATILCLIHFRYLWHSSTIDRHDCGQIKADCYYHVYVADKGSTKK